MNTLLNCPTAKQWQKIGVKQHHGINIPLFSLRSKESCGIGEFPDLIPFFQFCKETGLDIIQLLPLNDTGNETSPYSAISAFALNPIHLGLSQLPNVKENPKLIAKIDEMHKLNQSSRCNYEAVRLAKDAFLQMYYKAFASQIIHSSDFKSFIKEHPWLEGFALFKTLRIRYQWKGWNDWEPELRNPTFLTYSSLVNEYSDDVTYHIFVQYLCFRQFEEIKKVANAEGIFLMGDIPILINRDSADVWLQRNLFDLRYEAGAPPDMFSKEGQVWGFPIYNWDEMVKENYEWWRLRLKVASHLYDIYRIDHIVGFFRIWSVPLGLPGHLGKYIPEDPRQWVNHGENILKMMISGTLMLPIGEDLGNVPPETRVSLSNLGICGTKVMRWERDWNGDKGFIAIDQYPEMSMTTVSIHDAETLQGWWKDYPQEAKDFAKFKGWEYNVPLSREHHFDILHDSQHTTSLFHINLLNEYLALIPDMTWPSPEDERINVPGTINDRNWSSRFRPFVEDIVTSEPLKKTIKSLLK